ncbi:APC family permease [Nibricoccus sp. IMCC34717]|uniref:APC family permease n=1 Tax=Nibricoccus sp. IMCC34717 TaxID=3034021 RepID=UPI00384E847B
MGALTFFGIAFVGPTAPYTFFGVGTSLSQGHLPLVYLFALTAMLFTAVSYGRMANAHPKAGSVYSYASAELHPLLGYFAGWAMILDYFFLPIISMIIIGNTLSHLVPGVSYAAWAIGSALLATLINIRGIQVTTGFTLGYNALFAVSAVWFVSLAVSYLVRQGGLGALVSVRPFYDSATFSIDAVKSAFAITVLSFLGFDGVSTLAEDARNPRRDIPRATVIACLACGVSFVGLSYLGQLIWQDWTTFKSIDAAFSEIGGRIGGPALYATISGFVLGQAAISAVASQASAARLLFGMSREGRLPHVLFGNIHSKFNTPVYSIALIGLTSALVPLFMDLSQAAEMVNFGAVLGFILVNLSAFMRSLRGWRAGQESPLRMLVPLLGLGCCIWIWFSLSLLAMQLGAFWSFAGVAWLAWITRGRFSLSN